jgi:hypothetical protein
MSTLFSQSTCCNERENTCLRMRFMLAATLGSDCFACGVGQKPAIIW